MKKCFKCGKEKESMEFYSNHRLADGLMGKCKECTKADARAARLARLEYYREYDRKRALLPHRVSAATRITKRWRASDTRRTRAHNAALRKHRKAPEMCQMCGLAKRLERHHPDYELPLLIVWLCKPCHAIADRVRRAHETVTKA